MLISTKGRYALRIMIDLAQHQDEGYIPLKDIAMRQEISEKYLESIISTLSKGRFVSGIRGKGGGYKLTRKIEDYTVGSIVELTDKTLSPVSCLEHKENYCERAPQCKTLPVWEKLDQLIHDYLNSVTLKDVLEGNV